MERTNVWAKRAHSRDTRDSGDMKSENEAADQERDAQEQRARLPAAGSGSHVSLLGPDGGDEEVIAAYQSDIGKLWQRHGRLWISGGVLYASFLRSIAQTFVRSVYRGWQEFEQLFCW